VSRPWSSIRGRSAVSVTGSWRSSRSGLRGARRSPGVHRDRGVGPTPDLRSARPAGSAPGAPRDSTIRRGTRRRWGSSGGRHRARSTPLTRCSACGSVRRLLGHPRTSSNRRPDEPLSRVDRLLRSKDQLAPGEPADQPLTILGEPDHRRRGPLGRLGPLSSSRRVRRAQLRGSAARMCLRTRTARFGRR
jgi:hypothetical protein